MITDRKLRVLRRELYSSSTVEHLCFNGTSVVFLSTPDSTGILVVAILPGRSLHLTGVFLDTHTISDEITSVARMVRGSSRGMGILDHTQDVYLDSIHVFAHDLVKSY